MGGSGLAFLAFVVDALTMSALMFILALAVALAQESLVARLRANTEQIKIWGGRILAAVGVWLIALAIWAEFFVQFLPV